MDDFQRSLTIVIGNNSSVEIIVSYGVLTGGSWATPPVPGSVIPPAGQQSYVNGVPDAFSALGGQILLAPANGGSISPIWSWPNGSGASGIVNTASVNGLSVAYQMINYQTNYPTQQVMINDAPTFS